jgi:hypothetical protein
MPATPNSLITNQPSSLPILPKADAMALKAIQQAWIWHSERLMALQPECVQADRRAAYAAFLAEPSPENEQRLAVLADDHLTAKRYAVLREAHAEMLFRLRTQAIDRVTPLLEQHRQDLTAEVAARNAADAEQGSDSRIDAQDIENRRALETVTLVLQNLEQMVHTPPMDHDWSPGVLAGLFQSAAEPPVITPQARPAKPVAQR